MCTTWERSEYVNKGISQEKPLNCITLYICKQNGRGGASPPPAAAALPTPPMPPLPPLLPLATVRT